MGNHADPESFARGFAAGVTAAALRECPYCRDGWERYQNEREQWCHRPPPGNTIGYIKAYAGALCSAPWRDTLKSEPSE